MTFSISTEASRSVRLVIAGALDINTVTRLRPTLDSLFARGAPNVVVDLSGLRMIDSSGVGVLVGFGKRLRSRGGAITFTGLRDQPLAVFRLLRIDRALDLMAG